MTIKIYSGILLKSAMVVVTLVSSLTACSPRVNDQINVPSMTGGGSAAVGREIGVNIRPMTDNRQNASFGEVAGSSVKGRGDVSWTVTAALVDSLHKAGIYPKPFVNATIGGEINAWNFSVLPGFPGSHAVSAAEISLRVFDTEGQVRYYATYSGNAETTGWFLGNSDMEELLASSMQAAIDQATNDSRLMAAMRRNS